jgi:cell division protein FtsL
MLRLTLLLLCLMLAAAAAGRYKAEAAVRETRNELRRLEKEKSNELSKIQPLRAEVAYLERPERLATIAEKVTDLEPLTGAQLLTAEDFQLAFGKPDGAAVTFNRGRKPVDVAQAEAPALR